MAAIAPFFYGGGKKMKDRILSDFIINQYDIVKLEELTEAFISLVETALIKLTDDDYDIRITQSYEMKIIGNPIVSFSSKIESFLISKYDKDDKLKELLYKYSKSFNNMTISERELFTKVYIKNEKKTNVMMDMGLYQYQFDSIRKSAVVKFCLVLGLDNYTEVI